MGINGIEKLLKLTTTVSTTNMHLFNENGKLKKYWTIQTIIDEFFEVRWNAYVTRKDVLLQNLQEKYIQLFFKTFSLLRAPYGANGEGKERVKWDMCHSKRPIS